MPVLHAAPKASVKRGSLWLASNTSKRWAELFFLAYSPFWILWALCILVPFQLYEVRQCTQLEALIAIHERLRHCCSAFKHIKPAAPTCIAHTHCLTSYSWISVFSTCLQFPLGLTWDLAGPLTFMSQARNLARSAAG